MHQLVASVPGTSDGTMRHIMAVEVSQAFKNGPGDRRSMRLEFIPKCSMYGRFMYIWVVLEIKTWFNMPYMEYLGHLDLERKKNACRNKSQVELINSHM